MKGFREFADTVQAALIIVFLILIAITCFRFYLTLCDVSDYLHFMEQQIRQETQSLVP